MKTIYWKLYILSAAAHSLIYWFKLNLGANCLHKTVYFLGFCFSIFYYLPHNSYVVSLQPGTKTVTKRRGNLQLWRREVGFVHPVSGHNVLFDVKVVNVRIRRAPSRHQFPEQYAEGPLQHVGKIQTVTPNGNTPCRKSTHFWLVHK